MSSLFQKCRTRIDKLMSGNLEKAVQVSVIGATIVASFSLFWTIYSNHCQDKQWTATYEAQEIEISEISEQNKLLQNALEELSNQNQILSSTAAELSEQNKLFDSSITELKRQNASFQATNEVLYNSLEELKRQNEIHEKNLDLLISEKGIQVRIGYVSCGCNSLWCLLDELSHNTLLIVDNELSKVLDLEHILESDPLKEWESFDKLKRNFGSPQTPTVVLLKIDLTANITALTNDLSLQMFEAAFPEIIPVALPKLSMYSTQNAIDEQGELHDMMQYMGKVEKVTYNFSDQFVGKTEYTTILCPVMIQSTLDNFYGKDSKDLLTPCDATYKLVCIPQSITFTDPYLMETINKVIRDLNDSAAITEYNTIIGFG